LVDNELGHWVPPWEKLPYNNPTRNPLARSYSFVKTAKLLLTLSKMKSGIFWMMIVRLIMIFATITIHPFSLR